MLKFGKVDIGTSAVLSKISIQRNARNVRNVTNYDVIIG